MLKIWNEELQFSIDSNVIIMQSSYLLAAVEYQSTEACQ
jgi:hypothetical protein